jgi:hypothetical protein
LASHIGVLLVLHDIVDVDRLPKMAKPWWFRYDVGLQKATEAFLQFEFTGSWAARMRYARAAMKTMFRDHRF